MWRGAASDWMFDVGCWMFDVFSVFAPGLLVCGSQIQWAFAAMDFGFRRGVSDEHTLQRSVRSEQRSLSQKDMPSGGLHRIWLLALLLLGHRSLRICSLVAPRQKPNAVQQMPTQFVNSTLGSLRCRDGSRGLNWSRGHGPAF